MFLIRDQRWRGIGAQLEIVGTSAGDVFLKSLRTILTTGLAISPRQQPTLELTGVQLRVVNPRARLVGPETGRHINPAFAVAEAIWILSGSDHPWIHKYNSQLKHFVGDGSPPGAYGPRIRNWGANGIDQLTKVHQLLSVDPSSRRAVIQIFDPSLDSEGGIDVPCTLSYRFLARSGKLHMFVTMRSQDVWLGFPYDIFSATIIMEILADWLALDLGECTISIDSLHLYTRDIPKTARTTGRIADDRRTMRPIRTSKDSLPTAIKHVITNSPDLSEGWQDAAQILASYRLAETDLTAGVRVAQNVRGPLGEAAVNFYLLRGGRA